MAVEGTELEGKSSMLPIILIGLFVSVVAAAYYFFFNKKEEKKRGEDVDIDETLATNTVGLGDVTYIISKLTPESTQLDVLLAVASTPESITWSHKSLLAREKMIKKRLEDDEGEEKKKKAEAKKSGDNNMFDLGDDWADEDDDDLDEEAKQKAKLAKAALEEKQKLGEELAKATGKMKIPIEGIDDGVIGQAWVENALAKSGAWPLEDLRFLKDMTFEYEGKQVSAMEHPGLRRNLCFVGGRINSLALNSHPELLQAATKQLIDPSYFKRAADFRQRCAMLLEATLRAAVGLRSYPLTKTIVEAVSIFKIGCKSCTPKDVQWFDNIMEKQYGILPRLKIENTSIENSKYPEMATDDVLTICLDLTRVHAENFTKQKVAMLQKQGIPPQIALQQYREGWWYFVTAERLDGETPGSCIEIKKEGVLEKVQDDDMKKFEAAKFEERLITAWPMIIGNVAQKSGKVKITLKAPSVAGNYKFNVAVKSQDFLGADQVFSVEANILDASTVTREPLEEETKDEDKGDKDEGKKDK
mmetsp:Transcript_3824/g.8238  ORF Transcript_3824/g.8238 Transcript_3824/m.8238 type:complete len:530 (+) Transcript_3824:188-1777(+)|eukprot:CAMPEP_0168176680 /NCGR_PEP_ID=MMETSP0139_2-20121125/7938_1 /TAXON_ID=44445 /ORGANISM="Pseudo-nitzschia australis, Strain 10249 10 AB" /LENGTH=529 /DNA_ID=CAMNT_0008095457 /DNA_START=158 /DNA_END=1747 /DNA_ORIENTATION=-